MLWSTEECKEKLIHLKMSAIFFVEKMQAVIFQWDVKYFFNLQSLKRGRLKPTVLQSLWLKTKTLGKCCVQMQNFHSWKLGSDRRGFFLWVFAHATRNLSFQELQLISVFLFKKLDSGTSTCGDVHPNPITGWNMVYPFWALASPNSEEGYLFSWLL